MSSSFVCNVYDKDEAETNAKYTGYHHETGETSNEHNTEDAQISFDNGDADWDGNGTPFPEDDVALIHTYTDDQCSVVRIVSTGADSYSPDIQIKDCQPPTTKVLVNDGTVNKDVPADNHSSDEYQWDFNGITHYHKYSWYGQVLCENVGIATVEYDFDDGDGYAEDDVHQYTDIGDYNVSVKVTNKCGLEATDTKTIRIKYNQPVVTLSNDPEKPKVNEDITVSIDINDPDNTITDDKRYIDDTETTDTTFSWSEVNDHVYKVTLTWNDGYEDQTFDSELLIKMENQPPTLNMEAVENEDDGSGEWTIKSGAEDPEDDLDHVDYWVYIDSDGILDPDDSAIEWVLINSGSVDLDLDLDIHINGDYKVVMQAVDGEGLKSDKAEITFTENDQEGGSAEDSGGGDCDSNGVFLNVGYNMFAFLGKRHSYFDLDSGKWIEDDGVEAKLSDLAKAMCHKYGLVWDDKNDDKWIGNYIKYLRSYSENPDEKKFRVCIPSKTPDTNDANTPLVQDDEDGNMWVKGVSVLLLQKLERKIEIDGATIPFK